MEAGMDRVLSRYDTADRDGSGRTPRRASVRQHGASLQGRGTHQLQHVRGDSGNVRALGIAVSEADVEGRRTTWRAKRQRGVGNQDIDRGADLLLAAA